MISWRPPYNFQMESSVWILYFTSSLISLMKTVIQTYKMMFGRNPWTAASLLIFWMNIFRAETCHPSEYLSVRNECCAMCPPGNRVKTDCTEFRSTSCQPCDEGTYMNHLNKRTWCFPCRNCDAGSGLKIHTACTTTSDTVCEPLEGFYCLDPPGSSCMTARKRTTCKPGQYISQKGTSRTNTVCEDCQHGYFSLDGVNCTTWTTCSETQIKLKEGSTSSDVICGSASSSRHHYPLIPVLLLTITVAVILIRGRLTSKKHEDN